MNVQVISGANFKSGANYLRTHLRKLLLWLPNKHGSAMNTPADTEIALPMSCLPCVEAVDMIEAPKLSCQSYKSKAQETKCSIA